MKNSIDQAAEWIVQAKRTVVFTGAGLSTESGIPDFRSPGGLWDRYNPEDFYFQNFIASQASREKYWEMATEMYAPMIQAQPNLAHRAIAEMERLGKIDCIITQNIDGLHQKAGSSVDLVIELHGTAMHVTCLNCHKRYARGEVQDRIIKGVKAPDCDDCGGPLKPATISFGQAMPEKETREAYERSSHSNLFIVIGSSLVVHPAASMPSVAKRNGARLIIINRDPTPYDDTADLVIHGEAGPTMEKILKTIKKGLGIGD